MCEGSQGTATFTPPFLSQHATTDLTIDLEVKEGRRDAERRGAIMLRLMAIEPVQARTIAICNAQLDIERVEHTADLADCAVYLFYLFIYSMLYVCWGVALC